MNKTKKTGTKKSLADDDVFWLYERNMNYYRCCKTNGNTMARCTNTWNQTDCYCSETYAVQPITIGDQTMPCRLQTKTYIPIGEQCPICMEGIYSKNNAYLTGCGHAYHKSCIMFVLQITSGTHRNLLCPFCRANLGRPEIPGRYGTTYNELDCLENFWATMDW